jgi:uncharacterized protein DUF3352
MRLKLGAMAVVAAALVAAGCGGTQGSGGGGSASGGPSVVPKSAAAYVSVDSNVDSVAWQKAQALLDLFPGKAQILSNLNTSLKDNGLDWQTDVKPALGDEIDLVWLDFQNNGQNLVGLTKPKDSAKFDALLAKGSSPFVHEQVDGWTVFAKSQAVLDKFDQARSDGTLGDESTFSDPWNKLPANSIAKAWLNGTLAQTALDQRLKASATPMTTKSQFGTLDSVAAAVTPGSDGVSVVTSFNGDLDLGGSSYHAELPGKVPSGAVLYLSFNDIGSRINKLMDQLGSVMPSFDQQRAQIELVLGYSLKDVFGLLDGEGAIAVYPSAGTPALLFVAQVSDESKVKSILDKLAALAAASGNLKIQTVQIGSVSAKEITLSNGTAVYAAVFDGMLVTTNNREAIQQMQAGGATLADDADYQAARSASRVPAETSGFVYASLNEALPYLFSYVEAHGGSVPQVAKQNTAPLRGLLLYGSKDGGNYTLTGFLGIK